MASVSEAPTADVALEVPHSKFARRISSGSIPVGGFAPGVILADRYRIIGMLGRGGMGEVYRADDLKLGQPVALKFLPRAFASDPVRRERFFAEVRITRQLAHANICRVYDIAEYEGQHFLSMEYIDGEDLASLVTRIGYLSNEKALDVARGLAAGLAAAHDRGVLHRDLKPANIMIDGRGRVRITDFGLAVAAGDDTQAAEIFGTPAYMAPEQFAGKGATVRSDIYALGLVLYEIYCGRKAFDAPTIGELRAQKESQTPTAPSEIRTGIDPIVEGVIMRCLERDPVARPGSASQLATALPGGDPMAAALAAGETPSPEMVAASGIRQGVRPAMAIALLAFIAIGSVAALLLMDRGSLFNRVNPPKPPAALVERIGEHLKKAGYTAPAADKAFAFEYDEAYQRYIQEKPQAASVNIPESYGLSFWYRESPHAMEHTLGPIFGTAAITPADPPIFYSGDILVRVDTEGRLRMLRAIPPQLKEPAPPAPPDWNGLFSSAGLDISQWTPVAPQWNPDAFADTQAAWQGSLPEAPAVPVRIEAAAYGGRVVSFLTIYPWVQPDRIAASTLPLGPRISGAIGVSVITLIAVIGAGLFLARRNLRLGRGDRRGAFRIMVCVQAALAAVWVLSEHHVATFWEAALIFSELAFLVAVGCMLWVFYIAFEPFVRRTWPHVLVSWTRFLSGEYRDPLLGRDVLAGCAAGVAYGFLPPLLSVLVSLFPDSGAPQRMQVVLNSPPTGRLLAPVVVGIFLALASLLLLVMLRVLLRSDWMAIAAFLLLRAAPFLTPGNGPIWLGGLYGLAYAAIPLVVVIRFGLLGLMTMGVVQALFRNPVTSHTSAWYANSTYSVLALIAAIAVYGFRTSLGDRRVLDISAD